MRKAENSLQRVRRWSVHGSPVPLPEIPGHPLTRCHTNRIRPPQLVFPSGLLSYCFVIHYHIRTTFYASFTTFQHVLRGRNTAQINISAILVFGLYMRKNAALQ